MKHIKVENNIKKLRWEYYQPFGISYNSIDIVTRGLNSIDYIYWSTKYPMNELILDTLSKIGKK